MTAPIAPSRELPGYARPAAATSIDPALESAPSGAVPCPECGAAIQARYCADCGEARPEPEGLRLRHLAGDLVEHLTSLDFKLVRTLVALVRRPGALTRDFMEGRRARTVRPLALYLLVSGAFFLAMSRMPFHMASPRELVLATRGAGSSEFFELVRARTGETRAQLADRVGASPLVEPRTSTAFFVPVLAGILALLHARRRRLVAEHVLLAVHVQTFLLVLAAGAVVVIVALGRLTGGSAQMAGAPADPHATAWGPIGVTLVAAGVLVGHLHVALRRVYGLSRGSAAWRAVTIAVAAPLALLAIRMLLILGVAAAYWR